mmetsp:Transcript_299/g.617  ORF Transcript_299/g.617 Transcript_299/m.617 type:complete len:256 (+) Transcript_299:462-1229(+)
MLLAAGGVLVSACWGLAQHRGAAHLCLRLPNTDHAHRSRQWRHRDIVHPTLEVHHHLRVVAAAADQQAPHGAGVTTQVGGAQPVCITPVLQLRQHLVQGELVGHHDGHFSLDPAPSGSLRALHLLRGACVALRVCLAARLGTRSQLLRALRTAARPPCRRPLARPRQGRLGRRRGLRQTLASTWRRLVCGGRWQLSGRLPLLVRVGQLDDRILRLGACARSGGSRAPCVLGDGLVVIAVCIQADDGPLRFLHTRV